VSGLKRAATRLGFGLAILASTTALATGGGGDTLRPALFEVTLNGEGQPEPVLFLQAPDGALYATAATFRQWRIRAPRDAPIRFEGELYYRLSSVPDVRVRLSQQDQSVAIELPATAFETQRSSLGLAADLPMTRPGSGAFMTYDVMLERAGRRSDASGAFEMGVFTPRGVGVTSFIAGAGSSGERLIRLDTSWAIDRPSNATSLRIGDSISVPGQGAAPVRFAGLHYFRNYAVRPGFLTMPLPAATGSAAVPSVVDIYVNNILQTRRDVAPGPFELSNIPVQSGGGSVRVVVRDLLGRELVSEQSYYATSQLLRRGLHDFSYEAGFLRRDFGRRSDGYGEFMVSTSHRFGVTDQLTAEAMLQASKHQQNIGVAIIASPFDLAQIGGSASVSRGDRGTGYRVAASVERRTRGLSFGILGEYRSALFGFIGMPDDYRPPRFTVQAFADLPIDGGSVGFNFLHRSLRGQPGETLAGVSGSYQLSREAMLQLYARRAVLGRPEMTFGANLTLSLGGRRSSYVTSEYRGGQASGEISFQDNPPAGLGGGMRTTASFGPVRRTEAAYTYNLPMATIGGQVARAGGTTGVRLTAAGSFGLLGEDVFASRSLGASFATVQVDGHSGVRVYADDQLVGVTGRDGSVTVPNLRAFEPNRLRIDEADLPLEAQIDANEQVVRPFARTGSVVRFPVRMERGVLMRVRREDGTDLPAGAMVELEGGDTFVMVTGSEVYVPNLTGTQPFRVRWNGGSCRFTATVPENDDPQPRLDGLVCQTEEAYAAAAN
jgi:outer membrane usher protein